KPLEVQGGRAVLPGHDPARVHLIAAKLSFAREVEVRQGFALEGGVLKELTPVPVRLGWGSKTPPLESLQGKLTARGEPLRVVAAERGPGDLAVVRLPDRKEIRIYVEPRLTEPDDMVFSLLGLGEGYWTRLVSPRPQEQMAGEIPAPRLGLFNLLAAVEADDERGVLFHLTDWDMAEEDALKEIRVADAVAVAGLQAAALGHRRAVLLVLSGPVEDRSRLDPAAVRSYLDSLGVPLYVWNLREREPHPAWEGALGKGLKADLDQQRILWVEGRHLPREVRLSPDVTEFKLLAK
ncbi:MAG TPA: hypothetical protein VFR31_12700, partial [Thermoanaerobaculia bacterium]|nr:hypothetical protein [Thermoanaerobaculia bacterium]